MIYTAANIYFFKIATLRPVFGKKTSRIRKFCDHIMPCTFPLRTVINGMKILSNLLNFSGVEVPRPGIEPKPQQS